MNVPPSLRSVMLAGLWVLGAWIVGNAHAYQVVPKVSDVDRKLGKMSDSQFSSMIGQGFVSSLIPWLKSPVHESVTLAALGCEVPEGEELRCVTQANVRVHRMVLYGARWPDDPPFRLDPRHPPAVKSFALDVTVRSTAQPECWLKLFEDAARRAKSHKRKSPPFGPGDMLLYRSHFGDLQFAHAMGSYDGEPASETKKKMRMWAQFLWGVATGKLRTDVYLRDLRVEDLGKYFPGDMTASSLLATGVVEPRAHLREVAIGALLHMVQDSFSKAHVARAGATGASCYCVPNLSVGEKCYQEPGRIQQFLSYVTQDGKRHDKEDTIDALRKHTLQDVPSVVTTSREIIGYWRAGASWEVVSQYLDCVLVTEGDPVPHAGPGLYGITLH